MGARLPLTPVQSFVTGLAAGLLGLAGLAFPTVMYALGLVLGLVFFGAGSWLRLSALARSPRYPERRRLSDHELPSYTVLVPLYREGAILPQLVQALDALDYPRDRLEILLLVEADDEETKDALERVWLPSVMRVVIVPPGRPRTKPRALNHGLMVSSGELVCIFDAEDVPERDQLRRAAEAFAAADARLACVQARLEWYNARKGWLPRCLELEYAAHFDVLLPEMAMRGWPLPLGGTSNHFRRRALEAVGGWDAWNVTEDADLGLRLARCGFRSHVLDSRTGEEACERWLAWHRQRCRWIKGWMQTWLVHVRRPRQLWSRCGVGGAMVLHAFLAASVLSMLGYPLFLWMGLQGLLHGVPAWLAAQGAVGHVLHALGMTVFLGGHAVALAMMMAGACRRRQTDLVPWIALMPAYWLLVSLAAWHALIELLLNPAYWHKTPHGQNGGNRRQTSHAEAAG